MKGRPLRRLKYLARINQRELPEQTDPSYEFRYVDISAVGRGVLERSPAVIRFFQAPSRARRLVRPGDTIVSTVRTYLRAVWPVEGDTDDLVVSTGFAVISPGPELEPGYFGWLAQSDPFIEEVVACSVGVSYPAINATDIGNLLVPLLDLTEQRRIADFLDRETARIDAVISMKIRLKELVREQAAVLTDRLVWDATDKSVRPAIPFRRVVQRIDVGIAEAATHAYADEGVPLIRATNIIPNGLRTDDLLLIALWFAERNRRKFVFGGDILTIRTGNAGVSAVVPAELNKSQCFTQLISTVRAPNIPEFFCYALNSSPACAYFQTVGWGSAQANISVPLLAQAPVPLSDPREQAAAVDAINAVQARAADVANALDKQLKLLGEYRQGLIAAAVMGDLSIPAVAA